MPNDYSNDSDRPYDERNSGSGRDYTYSSARDYRAAGELGDRDDRDDRNFRGGGTGYGGGQRPDNQGGRENYGSGNRDYYGSDRDMNRSEAGQYGSRQYGSGQYGSGQYGSGQNDRGYGQQQYRDTEYRGAYASDGHRFTEGQNDRDRDRNRDDQYRSQSRDYGRAPQGYDYQDRGFIERAGDEVRSWFGDEEAERRREYDQRYDERQNQGQGGSQSWGSRASSAASSSYGRDEDYHNWRRSQMDELDRDYHEYRQENAKKFESEFGSWRTNRQTQRTSLTQVKEHMEVVGSDGEHVGTVDKTRDDRIILTKNDIDAGGRHHSIPSSWLKSVDDKVTISKTAAEAKQHWRDEEGASAMFGNESRGSTGTTGLGGTTAATTTGATTGGTTTDGTTGSTSYSSTSTKY